MDIFTTTTTLLFVMDPLGNIPVFITILKPVEPARRWKIILRESIIAFIILVLFLFAGQSILKGLGVSEPALGIAGGIILFIIALRMIFPSNGSQQEQISRDEPFIVPLAIPLIAGPSAIATILLFVTQNPTKMGELFISLLIAAVVVTIVLLFSHPIRYLLREKGLIAMERLMGMILTIISVQMFLTGVSDYFHLH